MRLVNARDYGLEVFSSARAAPEYAVLSHTWGADGDEVSFQEMTRGAPSPPTRDKKGFEKIKEACRLATAAGIGYVWVDTCCIDKSSSAELSEAINSMFKWYQRAKVCYAFLADWGPSDTTFEHCRWWKRGWTLQELLAPATVEFYDQAWQLRGTKATLVDDITRASRIDQLVLKGTLALSQVPVGARMFWASGRSTTREEDEAYCLLGIFDVNMPMLYGEGQKAFQRLQDEILRSSPTPDLSILGWRYPQVAEQEPPLDEDEPQSRPECTGVFAPSPRYFSDSALHPNRAAWHCSLPALSSGQFLEVEMVLPEHHFHPPDDVLLPLTHHTTNWHQRSGGTPGEYLSLVRCVRIREIDTGVYVRANAGVLEDCADYIFRGERCESPRFKLCKSLSRSESDACARRTLRFLQPLSYLTSVEMGLDKIRPKEAWSETRCCLHATTRESSITKLYFRPRWPGEFSPFVLICRFRNPHSQILSQGYWECDVVEESNTPTRQSQLDNEIFYPLSLHEDHRSSATKVLELTPRPRKFWQRKQVPFTKRISVTLSRKEVRDGITEFSIDIHAVPPSNIR